MTQPPKRIEMAEDEGRQSGEDDGGKHVATAELPLADPSSLRTKTASAPAAGRKSGYYSGRGYRDLKDLPRHERRRIEREIQKGRKPGESWDNL